MTHLKMECYKIAAHSADFGAAFEGKEKWAADGETAQLKYINKIIMKTIFGVERIFSE